MNKGSIQNFFEDFHVGQTFACPTPRVLTNADRVAYISYTNDRMPRFCDSHNRIHPLIVFHTVMGQTVRQISLNAVANLGYAEMRWLQPVHVGDTLSTTATIIGLKENSNRKSGIVYVKTVGRNQWNEVVLEYVRWVMVRKNREGATQFLEAPIVPTLQQSLPPGNLTVHSPDQCYSKATAGHFFFEDYDVGEKIVHGDGMMVNASDHMCFTRLYQNTARVHFDGLLTNNSPLVYGGYPLSLGYALAFNGLENRLGIVAINGGSHSNPVHTGDTLFALTEVLGKADVSQRSGAMRLRMIVVKNENIPGDGSFPVMVENDGRSTYHPNVVLDLDFWELMMKKGPS